VPRANNLTGIGRYVGGDMPRSLELDASAAIYVGLLKDPGTIPVQCPTGNCTFNGDADTEVSYQTLGFESTCVDISAEVKQNNSEFGEPKWYVPAFSDLANGYDVVSDVVTLFSPVLTMSNLMEHTFQNTGRPNASTTHCSALQL
jgi:hypothetical protein